MLVVKPLTSCAFNFFQAEKVEYSVLRPKQHKSLVSWFIIIWPKWAILDMQLSL